MSNDKTVGISIKVALWLPVVATLLTLALGVLLSDVQNTIGWRPLIAAIAICLAISYLGIILSTKIVYAASIGMLDRIQTQIDGYISKDSLPWLSDLSHLASAEIKMACKEIWLVSGDLCEDIPGSAFFQVVHTNLKRGIKYRYYIPKSLQAEARATQILENHKGSGKLEVVFLPDDFFFLSPGLDIVIYDPLNTSGHRSGYLGLPVSSSEHFHASLRDDFVDIVIGRLQRCK